ncbi:MAG: hypothetical protein F6J90_06945 [Moorea sp. SIOASIH]|nr:hypothetical protein [Moorena sp. SIOASIH]
MGRWGDGEMGSTHRGRFFTFGSGVGSRESGIGSRQKREMGRIIPEIMVYFDTYGYKFTEIDGVF